MNTAITLKTESSFYPADNTAAKPKRLVVLLHAYQGGPQQMQAIANVVRRELPDADMWVPRLQLSTFSWANPDQIAQEVVEQITSCDHQARGYDGITIVGFSMGATLARKVWALANGARPDGTVGPGIAWGKRVDRIVQLAAFNRGWTLKSPLTLSLRIRMALGSAIANFCRYFLRLEFLALQFARGAAFLTQTRLQCLAVERSLGDAAPIAVQLLGTADDLIAPTDNVDLATGSHFYYLEAPNATHAGMAQLGDGDPRVEAAFATALTGSRAEIAAQRVPIEQVYDLNSELIDDPDNTSVPIGDTKVDHVIFVIHGIRDRGFWTRRMAREMKIRAAACDLRCRTVTSTYGYFAMLPFLLPWVRRSKVEWFLDQYVTAKALYPNARFSYVGHSNGTYLLAKALDLCRAVAVENVVFAGSVVRTTFPWSRYLNPIDKLQKQISGAITNYVATHDWVVAIFPNGLEILRLQDLGGAGHRGFSREPEGFNIKYVAGSHGAALSPSRWDEMADFVLHGVPPPPQDLAKQSTSWKVIGYLSPLIWAGIIAIVVAIGWKIVSMAGVTITNYWALAAFVLYLWIAYLVVTKV